MPILEANGASLSYDVQGEGPSVVFLHGLGANATTWGPQVRAFSAKYRTITVDFRGSGQSRDRVHPKGPFSIPQFAADVRAVLEHLGATPAHVVGLSLGGMVAFQLAVDHPDVVASLAIVNSGPAVVPRSLAERWALGVRKFVSSVFSPATFAKLLAPKLFPRPEHAALREEFKAMIAANDRDCYVATLNAILGWTVLDRIGGIRVPVVAITGDHDYTSVASKEAYVKLIPGAMLCVVEDARHALPMEAPEKFDAALAPFLERASAVARVPQGVASAAAPTPADRPVAHAQRKL